MDLRRHVVVRLLISAWLLACVYQTRQYATAWSSEQTLWRWAAQMAPQKPRPWVNYSAALMLTRQLDAALVVMDHAERVTAGAHVPTWDRRTALDILGRNRASVATEKARMSR